MKYSELLAENKKLAEALSGDSFNVRILSNIIVHQLKEILEFNLRKENVNAVIELGNYDNILQDSAEHSESQVDVIFWEISNIIDGFEYKAEDMEEQQLSDLLNRLKGEIQLTLSNLNHKKLIVLNLFSAMHFNARLIEENKFDCFTEQLNQFVKSLEIPNVKLVQLDKVLIQTRLDLAVDFRNFYSSKSLYTVEFFKNYSNHIKHLILPLYGKVSKALIFDCDNTLWKGVLGEDGLDGILMNGSTSKGKPFEAIQFMAKKLSSQGVLIGLCSKNNASDVDEVLDKHENQILKNEQITIKKVNWNNKAENLREMADALNIGLDSFVFVDDSDFEVGLIESELPQVKVYQVNSKNHLYPAEFAEVINRFYVPKRTAEDVKKVDMYKQQAKREASKDQFIDIQSYLKSLEIEIDVLKNEETIVSRMAQMTQKTNQFNLTTKRYSEAEITSFLKNDSYNLYALSVKDKYGESGITGLAIIKNESDFSEIDSFLLSCRVIGRGIEDAFVTHIISDTLNDEIKASYKQTKKNHQVRDFYEKFGFHVNSNDDETKEYKLIKGNFVPQKSDHIKVSNGK